MSESPESNQTGGGPGHLLHTYADQLAEVFTAIFNIPFWGPHLIQEANYHPSGKEN